MAVDEVEVEALARARAPASRMWAFMPSTQPTNASRSSLGNGRLGDAVDDHAGADLLARVLARAAGEHVDLDVLA